MLRQEHIARDYLLGALPGRSSGGWPGWGERRSSEQILVRQGRDLWSGAAQPPFSPPPLLPSHGNPGELGRCVLPKLGTVSCWVFCGQSRGRRLLSTAVNFTSSLVLPLFLPFFPGGSLLMCSSAEIYSTSVLFSPHLLTLESYAFIDHVWRMLKQAH